jgi:6,7-dimethyl-8-ribityllumazine synthase
MTTFSGHYSATQDKIAIIAGRFNNVVTDKLVAGAEDALSRHGVAADKIDVIWVPGAFEIPAIVKLAASKGYAGIITLGAVIRGETSHFDYVCNEVAKGIGALTMQLDQPLVFGVLTCDNLEQAMQRAGGKAGNKGFDVANDVLELIDLRQQLA